MAGITLAQAQAQLDLYLAAEADVLTSGQTTRLADRQRTRADLAEIRQGIKDWQATVSRLSSGRSGMRFTGITPLG